MKKSLIICFTFLIISFFIISCNNNPDTNLPTETTESTENPETTDTTDTTDTIDTTEETKDNFPKLKIINKAQITITSVSLEGYSFSNLSLKQNKSVILELKDRMPAGYKNVRVSIRYRPYKVSNSPTRPIITNLNFADGAITSLEITGRFF